MAPHLLCFGDVYWEQTDSERYLSGSAFLTAAHAARCGATPRLYCRIGEDPDSIKARQHIENASLDTSCVQSDARRTIGLCRARFPSQGPEFYSLASDASFDAVVWDNALLGELKRHSFDGFCFSTTAVRTDNAYSLLPLFLEHIDIREVLYDINLRDRWYSRTLMEDCFQYATIVKLSLEELPVVSTILFGRIFNPEQFADSLSRTWMVPLVLLTDSGNGCHVYNAGDFIHCKSRAVSSGDQRGTGDAFTAAFLNAYLSGMSIDESCGEANEYARSVAKGKGPLPL